MRKNGAHFYLAMAIQIKIWVAGTVDRQRGGAQRAKIAKKFHKPPLAVNTINFELL